MADGELYLPTDPALRARRRFARTMIHQFNALHPDAITSARELLTELLAEFGTGSTIRAPFYCDYGDMVKIGARTFLNFGVVILDCALVTIGDDVNIASGVQLVTASHPLDPDLRKQGWESSAPITIGSGAWVGAGAIICPGVTIGADAVIGAGSVVIRDIPGAVVAAGNPCRVIRSVAPG